MNCTFAFCATCCALAGWKSALRRSTPKAILAVFLHLYPGEEAVAVGVLHATEPGDYVVSTYREHIHALVRRVPMRAIVAELFGKRDGCSRGLGGSMHLFDAERRFMGGYAIVGETYPIAIGAAYAVMLRGLPEAVICFFGDGAVNQGTFHESLNMAALWKLPVLFICENNPYHIGTEIYRHSAVIDVHKRACAYGIPAAKADGMDVEATYSHAREALARVRAGEGPQLLEFETYRYRGHSMADPGAYRPPAEVAAYAAQDPIAAEMRELALHYPNAETLHALGLDSSELLDRRYVEHGHLDTAGLEALEAEIRERIDVAIAVDTAGGLITPVLRDALRSLDDLAEDWRVLKGKIEKHRLMPADYSGATFYLSNLGEYRDVEQFDAIVPSGATAVLAVAAPGADKLTRLTLSCDHRVVAGVDAARFLATLIEHLAEPDALVK